MHSKTFNIVFSFVSILAIVVVVADTVYVNHQYAALQESQSTHSVSKQDDSDTVDIFIDAVSSLNVK